MDGKNNSLEKPNITDTSETLPDGKRMTVSSILRYKNVRFMNLDNIKIYF